MTRLRFSIFPIAGVVCLAMLAAAPAFGSGFAIVEQSASEIGKAFSGATAGINDPSCIFFNPAALTGLEGRQFVAGIHSINPQFDFDDEGSAYPLLGMPLSGGNGGNGGERAFVPNLYYAQDLARDAKIGLGINAPYGLTTEYSDGWVGRYHALRTDLVTMNINPTLAWKINDMLSVGLGFSAQYVEAELTSAIDFGGILAAQGVPGAAPQLLDGKAKIEGDDWGYGFNVGLQFRPSEAAALGLHYRSSIEYTLEGDASFTVPAQAAALSAMGLFVDTDAEADLETPETVALGYAHRVGEALVLSADITWTRWSRFEELRVSYDSNQPDSVTEEDWEDTFKYAVGLSYEYSPKWTFRAGTAYDETPIPDKEHRTPRIPDGDRIWMSVGAGYRATDTVKIDAGYTYLLFDDTDVDIVGTTGDRVVGEYSGSANIGSIQATVLF